MKFRGRREPPPFSVGADLSQGEQNVPATSVEGSAQRAGGDSVWLQSLPTLCIMKKTGSGGVCE